MGCTSSASNVAESQTSTTDNLENNVISPEDAGDKAKNQNIYSSYMQQELEKKPELPERENLSSETQVSSNNNNPAPENNNANMDTKDIQVIDPTITDVKSNTSESLLLGDNFTSLKDVVEKVILDNVDINEQQITVVEEISNTNVDRHIDETIVEPNDSNFDDEIEPNDEDAKESTSPTQSEDSRATRWEALADIAAELPPSLAVDPLTGQIYSLTK